MTDWRIFPAGGQGMNLGLRDAVGLGPVLAEHHKASLTFPCPPDIDKPLSAYAAARHARGVGVIQLTKTLVKMTKAFKPIDLGSYLSSWILSLLGKFQFVRNAAAWRLSGLGAR
jgi:2-polyprenyl-6-methoxyphenol hydroxylase-like FAD-dependent oxidoreductase